MYTSVSEGHLSLISPQCYFRGGGYAPPPSPSGSATDHHVCIVPPSKKSRQWSSCDVDSLYAIQHKRWDSFSCNVRSYMVCDCRSLSHNMCESYVSQLSHLTLVYHSFIITYFLHPFLFGFCDLVWQKKYCHKCISHRFISEMAHK